MDLSSNQQKILEGSTRVKTFLSGRAGAGKTTLAVEHLRMLLNSGVSAGSILVLTPQRTLQIPFESVTLSPQTGPGGKVTFVTVGGLARRMVELFWPLVAATAGFSRPDLPPVFLTLETAQYYMSRLVRPLREEGFFASVTIDPNRLYSQILDNLNKSASIGFPYTEIGSRLSSAWVGDPGQRRVYSDAHECATRFRQYCLAHNLLDFSLQLDIFWNLLWRDPLCHAALTRFYRHLIYDNVEEDIPVPHDLVAGWLPEFDSALLIFDTDAGYRRFLGADPDSALRLAGLCDLQATLDESFVSSPEIRKLEASFVSKLLPGQVGETGQAGFPAIHFAPPETPTRFFPQMLDWVATETSRLIKAGLPASEIVILAPYFSDSLRFSLSNRLETLGVPWHSHRPSRTLRDEPASLCLLTLAVIAHPHWEIRPTRFDLARAILYAIDGMDLVRAQLLTEIVYRLKDFSLSPFEVIQTDVQERITFFFGENYEVLRNWIMDYRQQSAPDPFDHFLRRLFGEVLSQKGFGFHRNMDGARTAASLVESVEKFRQTMEAANDQLIDPGREYQAMLQEGVIAAQYVEAWRAEPAESVLLAPAYTFLMMNRPVTAQFWLDVSSNGWWERLFQPLTQPYVLSRSWPRERTWTDVDDLAANQEALCRLVTGLLRRCRSDLYLGMSDIGEMGTEQRGPLLKAVWKMQLEGQVPGEG